MSKPFENKFKMCNGETKRSIRGDLVIYDREMEKIPESLYNTKIAICSNKKELMVYIEYYINSNLSDIYLINYMDYSDENLLTIMKIYSNW